MVVPPHADGAPVLSLVSTPLHPPVAVAVVNQDVNAALTTAWDWHPATEVLVGQFKATGL